MKRNFIFQSLMLLCTLILGTGSVYADDAKWVKRDISKIQTGDIVVIADLNAGVAMTNNPAEDKSPNAPAIQLNEDKDRITGEVADTVKWKVTVKETDAGNKYVFEKYNEDGTYLNITDGNLRVSAVTARYSFDLQSVLLHLAAGSNEYYVGIKTSNNIINTSTEWNVKTEDNITEIRDTRMAFFVLSTKPDITLSFPYKNYEADYADGAESFTAPALTVDPSKTITYSSSDEKVATVDADGKVTLKKRGNVRITASFGGDDTYNEISTSYVLRVDQSDKKKKGSRSNPFTVKEATDLLAGNVDDIEGVTYQKGCSYFVKGIVSKVSSGMMDSFSDMFGDSMGDMDLEDMMGDIDMSNMNIPGMDMSSSEVTYYISDDGTKDNQMKVLKPNGLPTEQGGGAVTFDPIAPEGIGVGDVVVVYGPLIYTEDESMFGGMGGTGTGTGTGTGSSEQKYTAKVDEVNYIKKDGLLRRLLPGDVKVMYENTKKPLDAFYKLNTKDFEGFEFPAEGTTVNDAQMKSSKKDVAKWEYTDEEKTDSLFSAVKAGTTNLVVKIKVIVQKKDPTDENSKEKSYTMKAKYPLKVLTRGVTPAGQNDGVYELVTKLDDLEEGDRLLIATTVDDKSYVLINSATDESNPIASFMGGGNTKEVTIEDNKISSDDLPEEAMILTLEKEDAFWLFNGGKNADGKNTYLYPSASSGGFDMSSLMGGGGATLKLGVREEVKDSCLVTITIDQEKNDSATVKFNIPDGEKDGEPVKAKNVIRYKSSMMSSSFSGFEETLADGNLPRIYRFVQSDQYTISTTNSTWQTLVSAYDVKLPEEIEAHVVTSVTEKSVNTEKVTSVKGGVPYLLKVPSTGEDITLKRAETPATAPEKNLLEISDSETTSGVYVLADKGTGAKFYLWQGGLLGSGRVYLPANDAARSLFSLEIGDDETTGVIELKNSRIEELEFYDLSGHRVMTPKKGVYVVNGKKVIIK